MRFKALIFVCSILAGSLASLHAQAPGHFDGLRILDAQTGFRELRFGKPLPSGKFSLVRSRNQVNYYLKVNETVKLDSMTFGKIEYAEVDGLFEGVRIQFEGVSGDAANALRDRLEASYGESTVLRSLSVGPMWLWLWRSPRILLGMDYLILGEIRRVTIEFGTLKLDRATNPSKTLPTTGSPWNFD